METPAPSRPAAPAVVAVVVTRNPGPWFDAALDALADQDYPNLAVLFIDSASDTDPTPRVASVLPDAYVRRLDDDRGYGAAANHVGEIVSGASFYCFLHDDAAPEPDAISTMVGEAVRSNAGIVGAKLVRLDDHRALLQVGESVDKTGERSSSVEKGELDQEQYDAVRDVFVTPSGCLLVRSDLFDAVGGFDGGIDLLNDDLNLCWRAHVAGARVVVAPDAVVGHAEALGERSDVAARRRRLMRHRFRTILSCYSGWHLVRVLPQTVFFSVLEVVYSVLVGRPRQARDVIAAWGWNLRRRREIREWRARIKAFRGVSDAEIRRFQIRGSARVSAFLRGQTSRGGTRSARVQERWRSFVRGVRRGELRWPILTWTTTAVILGFGSRHLLLRDIASVGGFPDFDLGPRGLFDAYLSGWRTAGLGSTAPAPTAFALLAGAGTLFLGAMGALRQAIILGSLVVGVVGGYRLLRPTASPRAQAAALVVYAAVPVGLDAVAQANWGALTAYALAPWLLAHLARAAGWAPFGDVGGAPGPGIGPRRPVSRVAAIGLLLALATAVDPSVAVVALVVGGSLAVGSLLAGAPRGGLRVLLASVGGVAVAVVLHVPWTLDFFLPGSTWASVVTPDGTAAGPSLADLTRFQVGPVGGGSLALGLHVAAALPLLIGRGWRFEWAVRAWVLSLTLVGVVWVDAQGWLPVDAPRPATMLAPAAVALAVAIGMGVVAFEVDLRAYGFGWRQIASGVAAVGLVVGATPTLLDAGNGRWYLPSGGLETTFGLLDEQDGGFRVLWIGDPDVMPLPGRSLDIPGVEGMVYATSADGLPSITDGWVDTAGGPIELVGDALVLAADGETSRLGRLLAPMAIRYVVLPSAMAPRPLGGPERPRSEVVEDALADQLDLAVVAVNPAYLVYRNQAALPAPATIGPTAGVGTAFDVDAEAVAGASPVLTERTGPTTWTGPVVAGSRILHSADASDGWELRIDGRDAEEVKLFGWAQGFELSIGGDAVLRYDTSPLRYGVLGFQALFWLLAIRSARHLRRHRPAETPDPADGPPAEEGSAPEAASAVTPADQPFEEVET